MKKSILTLLTIFAGAVSYSQEHYYEANKIFLKKTGNASIVENYDVALLLNENAMTCSVRIDYKDPQIFKITSSSKDPQSTIKMYELVHKDGRKITLSVKKKRMTVDAHTAEKKYEADIIYSKTEKV